MRIEVMVNQRNKTQSFSTTAYTEKFFPNAGFWNYGKVEAVVYFHDHVEVSGDTKLKWYFVKPNMYLKPLYELSAIHNLKAFIFGAIYAVKVNHDLRAATLCS